jgi:anti-sigma regulatory factor (Ser/Thr protein kinase)
VTVDQPLYRVELAIPGRPEFVGVARLSLARVASLKEFSFDAVEDIRLAVGEACTRAIDRLTHFGMSDQMVRVTCVAYSDRISIEVCSPLTPAAESPVVHTGDDDLGSMLVQILMDDLSENEDAQSGTHTLKMAKYLAR